MIDALRVGDLSDLPLGIDDPSILLWAEREGRFWSRSMEYHAGHLNDHLAAGHGSPGVFLIRPLFRIPHMIAFLSLAAYAGDERIGSIRSRTFPDGGSAADSSRAYREL